MSEEKDLLILEKNTPEKQMELRYKELEGRGIPEPERTRAVQAEFVDYPNQTAKPWPGDITGIDLAGNINLDLIPASREPPIYQPNTRGTTQPFPTASSNPYPNNPTPDPNSIGNTSHTYNVTNFPAEHSSNWLGTASQVDSEPSMEGEHGFNVAKSIPEWRYPIEDSQIDFGINIPPIIIEPSGQFNEAVMAAEVIGEFTLSPQHTGKDVCDDYVGKSFNLTDTSNRPILPSEGKGYTNLVHPNCHCTWNITKKTTPDSLTRKQQSEFGAIESHIKKAAKDHTLHTVKPDGSLSQRTRGTNPIKEALGKIRHQAPWLSNDYISKAKEAAESNHGVLYLVRAATESITDHTSEGEKYRRKLSGKELNSMARTATGKNLDINHNSDYATGGMIPDAEYDDDRKEIQMLVMETDPQINQYIADGLISAVSINGGNPRSQHIEPCNDNCDGDNCELCNVPKGVILGEADGIGLTWVVTDPNGIMWRGQHIPQAIPGIKNTIIEIL